MKAIKSRLLLIATVLIGVILINGVAADAATATVAAGQAVTLTVTAEGSAPFSYQWYKDGSTLSGATDSTYTFSSFQAANAGTYAAVISNSVGSTTSDEATLTLGSTGIAPAFTTQPASQTVTAGGSVTFSAAASGTPTPTYQWKKGGTAISGATGVSYTIAGTVAGDAGTYTVVATNSVSSVSSNAATLTVNTATTAPVFTTQPGSKTVVAGSSVTFTAAASGSPSPTYQWKKGGVNISGATGVSYTIGSVTSGAAGNYTVVATNSVTSVTSATATLTVNSAPAFTTQPASKTVTVGASVTFTAAASGFPSPTYQWKKGGLNISGATGASYSIGSVASGDAGSFTVVATNSVTSVTSATATLTVNSAPVFTTQPASKTVTAGSSVTFTAAAAGSPSPTYQWKKGGVNISGATGASFTIGSATSGDAGSFTVVATNSASGVTSSVATLTVNAAATAPVFTTQPVAQIVVPGNSATFTVVAGGSPTPTIQWRKNGASIPGATNASYTISKAAATDEAYYSAIATNAVSSVASNAAFLTVFSSPSNAVVSMMVE